MKRRAFTMIELIFVVMIVGMLAAIAIPKLAATRDDAVVSKEVTVLSNVVGDLGSQYTAQGTFSASDIINANFAMGCYSVTGTNDGNLTVTEIPAGNTASTTQTGGTTAICTAANLLSRKQKLSGSTAVVHTFGGANTIF